MERREFIEIRHHMGRTQAQLARLLCISEKAVQSFEQGWRKIPASVERQLLLLSSLETARNTDVLPCWEIKNCPNEWRENCIAWEYRVRHYCWLLTGTYCQGTLQKSWKSKVELCHRCEVFLNMFSHLNQGELSR